MPVKFAERLESFARIPPSEIVSYRINSRFEFRLSGREVKPGELDELNQAIATLRRKLNKNECYKLRDPVIYKHLYGAYKNLKILTAHLEQKPLNDPFAEEVSKISLNVILKRLHGDTHFINPAWALILEDLCDDPSQFLTLTLTEGQLKALIRGPTFKQNPFLFIGMLFGEFRFWGLATMHFHWVLNLGLHETALFCRKLEALPFRDTYACIRLLELAKVNPNQNARIINAIYNRLQRALITYLNPKTVPDKPFYIEDEDFQIVVGLLIKNRELYASVQCPRLSLKNIPNVKTAGLNCLVTAFPQIDITDFNWTDPAMSDTKLIPRDYYVNFNLIRRACTKMIFTEQSLKFLIKWLEIIHQPNIDVHTLSREQLSYYGVNFSYERAARIFMAPCPSVCYEYISSFENFILEMSWAYENGMNNLLFAMDEIFCLLADNHPGKFQEFKNRVATLPDTVKLQIAQLQETKFVQRLTRLAKIP